MKLVLDKVGVADMASVSSLDHHLTPLIVALLQAAPPPVS